MGENKWNPFNLCEKCQPKFDEVFRLGQESGKEILEFYKAKLEEANRRLEYFADVFNGSLFSEEEGKELYLKRGPVPEDWEPKGVGE